MDAALTAVIFDIDGTLVDSVDLHAKAWQEALARFNRPASFEHIRSQIGKGGDQILPALLSSDDRRAFGDEIRAWRGEHFKRAYMPNVRPFPKVRDLFQALIAKGIRLTLGSSASEEELDALKKIARVDDLIESATSSKDVKKSKPHPDIFVAALERLGRPSTKGVVAVGDSPYDALAAGKAGLKAVGVRCGGFPEQDLREAGCTALFEDPADILERLEDFLSGSPK